MITKNRVEKRRRVKTHIRLKINGTSERPRLTIYRSLKHVYAQIIDDVTGKTLVAVSDLSKEAREQLKSVKGQTNVAKQVGQLAAKKAIEKNIKEVVFDRNGFIFHGVVKAMADGAREGGLKF
jgi:large subunit ribosomal protein L18